MLLRACGTLIDGVHSQGGLMLPTHARLHGRGAFDMPIGRGMTRIGVSLIPRENSGREQNLS